MSEAKATAADDHLFPAGRDWAWWREVALRGAGFPAEGVLDLADAELAARADALVADHGVRAEEIAAFRPVYDRAVVDLDLRLQQIARSPRFREAITWQNHRVLDSAIDPLLRWTPARGRDRKHRGHEELVAGYWQRYCVKNDSIGFFGPVGWGRLAPDLARVELRPGEKLVASADVYFEAWALDALAETVTADPATRPWLPVRRAPFIRVTDTAVELPGEASLPFPPPTLAVLRACTPGRRACDVAAAVRGAPGLEHDEDVYAVLEELAARRLVVWKLEVPVAPRPESALRALLERIGERTLRRRAVERLEMLERARDRVAAEAGNANRLRPALRELDAVFERLTGAASLRHAGRTYAGRTLVYHDGRRDVELKLGAPFLDALAPLTLLLDSARWLTWEVGRLVRESLASAYDESRAEGAPVFLSALWLRALPLVDGVDRELDRIEAEYHRRWDEILRCPRELSRVRYSAAELVAPVREAFDAPRSGWVGSQYCSPDVMIAAGDVDAIAAGDFEVVLGELHLAINALRHSCFVAQHPAPERLLAAVAADFPRPRLLAVLPKENPPKLTTRLHSAFVLPTDRHVALFHHSVDPTRSTVVAAADVVVERSGHALVARLGSNERFDLMGVFADVLTDLVLDRVRIFGAERHSPRVNFDSVVVAREAWRFGCGELAFAREPDEAGRFLRARKWWCESGLPRQVFVKTPLEQKPFYVDFESPFYVNVFAKAVRRMQRRTADANADTLLTITEMLPRPDQAWLVDREGRRYTSEVRLVAVDLRGAESALHQTCGSSTPSRARRLSR